MSPWVGSRSRESIGSLLDQSGRKPRATVTIVFAKSFPCSSRCSVRLLRTASRSPLKAARHALHRHDTTVDPWGPTKYFISTRIFNTAILPEGKGAAHPAQHEPRAQRRGGCSHAVTDSLRD